MTYTTDFLTLKRITEPQDFIAGQETAIVEFDDGLVRKLINQILVYLKPLTSNLITRGGSKSSSGCFEYIFSVFLTPIRPWKQVHGILCFCPFLGICPILSLRW